MTMANRGQSTAYPVRRKSTGHLRRKRGPRPRLECLESRTLLSFAAPANFDTGNNPVALAVGDFNHDGIPDLVTADAGPFQPPGDTVSVLLGNGDGTFRPAVNYTVAA